jgi:hypothetical protein
VSGGLSQSMTLNLLGFLTKEWVSPNWGGGGMGPGAHQWQPVLSQPKLQHGGSGLCGILGVRDPQGSWQL